MAIEILSSPVLLLPLVAVIGMIGMLPELLKGKGGKSRGGGGHKKGGGHGHH